MKKNVLCFALLLAALSSCSNEEVPVQQESAIPAPVLSRSLGETTATIIGYSASGTIVFNHDLLQTDAEKNIWEWTSSTGYPTMSDLRDVEELVCLIPKQKVYGKTFTVTPDEDDRLLWDKKHVSEQDADGRFYFKNVRHQLAQICVEVDRYSSSDDLYAYFRPGGTFDCLTGEFTSLKSLGSERIVPKKNDEGVYVKVLSVVPQTFDADECLLRYCDELGYGYRNYYHNMPDTAIVLNANRTLHIHTQWDVDWEKGRVVYYAVDVTGVTLTQETLALEVGESGSLTATVSPSNADDKSVTWSSSNPAVATVDANGKVTAVGPGTATITVKTTDGGYTDTCTVTVKDPTIYVTSVTVTPTELAKYEGEEATLTATVSPSNATDKSVTWSSSNPAVATVENGVVKAVKAGTATITVTTKDGNKTATCTVTVKAKGGMGTEEENMNGNGSGTIPWNTTNNGN